jgi:hypothetical protein
LQSEDFCCEESIFPELELKFRPLTKEWCCMTLTFRSVFESVQMTFLT